MTKKYSVNKKMPSRMFLKSIVGGGNTSITCNCGRTHYAPQAFDYSNDTDNYEIALAECLLEHDKDPDGVIINYEDDFVYYKELGGQQFVEDCPCNGLRRYEDFIWGNRNSIREYYKVRVEQEACWAEQEVVLNKLAGIQK